MRDTTARPDRRGRRAGLLAAALVGSLLPLLGTAGPAAAAQDCVTEQPDQLGLQRCDDVTPPETGPVVLGVLPNAAGWLSTGEVSLGFQCRLEGPVQAHGCKACTSPFTPAGVLEDSGEAEYRFSVRGVDATPSTATFKVDTVAPVGLVFGRPSDPVTPDSPVLHSRDLRLTLYANEPGVTFPCTLDGAALPCRSGAAELSGLASGRHVFRATLLDAAGNVGSGDLDATFWVASDLRGARAERRTWSTVRRGTASGGSVLDTSRRGATLAVRARRVRELRLLAPTGPGLGRVRVRAPGRRWTTFDLGRGPADDKAQLLVRTGRSAPVTGLVEVQVLSSGKPVRVDGLVLR